MGSAERERARAPVPDYSEPSGQTEESWLLFEGIYTFLYDLMRKSKIDCTWYRTQASAVRE